MMRRAAVEITNKSRDVTIQIESDRYTLGTAINW